MAPTLLIRVGRRAPEVRVDDVRFGAGYVVLRMFYVAMMCARAVCFVIAFLLTVMPPKSFPAQRLYGKRRVRARPIASRSRRAVSSDRPP